MNDGRVRVEEMSAGGAGVVKSGEVDVDRSGGSAGDARKEYSVISATERGDNVSSVNEAERRILKTVINDYWRRGKKIVKKKEEVSKRGDVEDKGQESSSSKESKGWWRRRKRGGEKTLGRQSSRFEKSMRILEWLDADCGTRLAKHYEEAGGWRSLPARRQRQQPTRKPQRQPLRLTRSHLVLGTDHSQEFVQKSEAGSISSSSSSSSGGGGGGGDGDETKVLEDSEDFLDDVDAEDDDDAVLSLRKWQDEQPQGPECYEDLSLKEYVTSSDEDENENKHKQGDDSDSEDELVLALKAWKDEQLRQEKLLQQQQLHRQHSLAQQPPTLTPVLEDKVSSPTHEAFGYFYQDHTSVFYQKNSPSASTTPYWWGGISSVREGPSSPPILVTQTDISKGSHFLLSPRLEPTVRSRDSSSCVVTQTFPRPEASFKYSKAIHGSVQSLAVTTTLGTATSQSSFFPHHSGILQPPSTPFASSSLSPSPRHDTSNWNFNRGCKSPLSPTPCYPGLQETKSFSGKFSDTIGKGEYAAASPRTPLSSKLSNSGFSVFSTWLSSAPGEKQTPGSSVTNDVQYEIRTGDAVTDREGQPHKVACMTLSTTSSDSGIEKSPGYLSPAPRSAGIEKIGDFFRRFHHKLSASSSPPSTIKTPPPLTPSKHLQQQHKTTPRRLSLSTPSIPCSSLLKPTSPSPVAKFTAAHARCSATKSDPLASGAISKRQQTSWAGVQQSKNTNDPVGTTTEAQNQINITNNNDGEGVVSSGEPSRLTADSGAVASGGTHSDRKVEATVQVLNTSGAADSRSGNTLTASGCVTKSCAAVGKDTEVGVPSYSASSFTYHLQHQPLSGKRSTGDVSTRNYVQDIGGATLGVLASKSGSRYFSRDNLDALKKSNEALDSVGEHITSTASSGACDSLGFNRLTKAASQLLRKSPVPDFEQGVHFVGAGESPSKSRTNTSGVSAVGGVCSGASVCVSVVGGSSSAIGSGLGDNAMVKSVSETKSKQKEELMRSELSALGCEEKGTLSVPNVPQDRGRRGSHGTCNFLFLDQNSGRKSPNPPKGRKSPSPIRGTLFKSAVNSTSTSSTSSTESSSKLHHHIVSRVQSLPSPSSPPPHQQTTPKTSPKHVPNLASVGSDLPAKTMISDGPPANYQGRRKFSDTGLTPLPRRLFNEGRRGSLTDERTLVSAKSKLGKLRNQGRKSSDAGSIAALVKQIHNLWGEKDDEMDDIHERRESVGGFSGSFDDQVLFDKRRKRFSLSIGRHKDGAKDESSSISNLLGDIKGKKKTAEKGAHQPVSSTNSSASSSPAHKAAGVTEDDACCLDKDYSLTEDMTRVYEIAAEDNTNTTKPAGGVISSGSSGVNISEFLAPIAQAAGRQLVATAVSGAACFVGQDTPDRIINRGPIGSSLTNISIPTTPSVTTGRYVKKTTTVQFQPIVSWDDNVVGGKIPPALRSVLKQGARRHSSFAGFSESSDNLSLSDHDTTDNISIVLNKQAINGLPKSKTSDNYKGILKQTDRPALTNIELGSSSADEKRRSKSPCPKSKKIDENFDHSPESKNGESSLSLCVKANRSVSPKSKKSRGDAKEVTDQSTQGTNTSSGELDTQGDLDLYSSDYHTKTVGIQATPRSVGKTSNTGTQTSGLLDEYASALEHPDLLFEGGGWLQRLAAKCMASVGGTARPGTFSGGSGGLPRAASVRAEWLLGNKRMGSGPSSPVAGSSDPSEKFWVPHELIARKRAQSLVPTLSKSEDDLSSEAVTPASASHIKDLAFTFPTEKAGAVGFASDVQPSTPPSGYNLNRRRASMHDAIDLNKIDTRLYDKKSQHIHWHPLMHG